MQKLKTSNWKLTRQSSLLQQRGTWKIRVQYRDPVHFGLIENELGNFLAREGRQVLGQFLVGAVPTLPVMASNTLDKNTERKSIYNWTCCNIFYQVYLLWQFEILLPSLKLISMSYCDSCNWNGCIKFYIKQNFYQFWGKGNMN